MNCVFEDMAFCAFCIDRKHNNHGRKIANFGGSNRSRTEEVRDALGRVAWFRFPTPLIGPDVQISAFGHARGKVKNSFPASPRFPLLAIS